MSSKLKALELHRDALNALKKALPEIPPELEAALRDQTEAQVHKHNLDQELRVITMERELANNAVVEKEKLLKGAIRQCAKLSGRNNLSFIIENTYGKTVTIAVGTALAP